MAFVCDASVALAWCFRDEANADTDRLLADAIAGKQIFVPAHWPTEILGALSRGARRQRIEARDLDQFLDDLAQFNIVVDLRGMQEQWAEALPLIRTYQLSAYDAAYLALAKRLQLPLATFDSSLRMAATVEGVSLII
jgi:predicted nucleic acid-binding protein